jgi:hypothetical protein
VLVYAGVYVRTTMVLHGKGKRTTKTWIQKKNGFEHMRLALPIIIRIFLPTSSMIVLAGVCP